MSTRICGDKMRYLTMFNSGGQISSDDFQVGVRFLDNLKPWGANDLNDCGYNIRSGSSAAARQWSLRTGAERSLAPGDGSERSFALLIPVKHLLLIFFASRPAAAFVAPLYERNAQA